MAGPADVVERLIDADDPAAATLALLAIDAEVRPLGVDVVLRGIAEIERYARDVEHDEQPVLRGVTLYEIDEDALVLAVLAVPHDGGKIRHTRVLSVGFVITVRDGEIKRIISHSSWQEAKEAVGLTPERESELAPRRRMIPRLLMRLWDRLGRGRRGATGWQGWPAGWAEPAAGHAGIALRVQLPGRRPGA